MNRRNFLKKGLGLGGAALVAPAIVSNTMASSMELNLYAWSDYISEDMIKAFEKETGIKVNLTTYGSNDEVLNKLRASKGKGFDIVMPSVTYGQQWYKHRLLQPLDLTKLDVAGCEKSMWDSSASFGGEFRGKRYIVPFNWGTEAITVNTEKIDAKANEVSYGDLWKDNLDSKVTVRAHSSLIGVGLYLDRIGKVKSNRMFDTYKDEQTMRDIYSKITDYMIEHKNNIRQFWSNAQETTNAFMQNGCVIGQTWDGPAMRMMSETNGKIKFMAPKEGAITWMDGMAIPKGAKNVSAAYAWINWYYNGGKSGAMHANASGYNSCAAGASKYLSAQAKTNFEEAYPGDAIKNLWWYPEEPTWFVTVRNEFRDKLLAAGV
ncbi:substrate-binding domain-containing protein [Halarcobacter sp.]|uniref:substrate-binding domain-containing protein n=1 Tax=Halarcobacter sp. TaxID=2321133 RepID=UPI002AAAAFE5|nr:substrate-binding domain-containing protein [Halarcobacter sp.]